MQTLKYNQGSARGSEAGTPLVRRSNTSNLRRSASLLRMQKHKKPFAKVDSYFATRSPQAERDELPSKESESTGRQEIF